MTARPQPVVARRGARWGALLGVALTLALGACRRGPERAGGGFAIDDAQLERHVRYETGLAPADLDRDGLARLRADLLGEALLARGAEKQKIAAPAAEVAAEAARLRRLLGPAAPADDVLAADARRRLLARLYDERVVAPLAASAGATADPAPAPTAVPPAAERAEGLLVFRQLRSESREAALRVVRRIARGEAFEDVAREVSTSPDRGRLLRRAPGELPEPVAAVLRAAREGEVAGPVETNGAYYVFALEGREAAAGDDPGAPDPAEMRLRGRRRAHDEARARRIAELAREEDVALPPELAEDTAP